MAGTQGNFGNSQQHARAGSMSSGNTGNPGNPQQHAAAGKMGDKAKSASAKHKRRGNSLSGML